MEDEKVRVWPVVVEEPSEAAIRRALRVLRMVHELHKAGYQRVRICPGMSGSGLHWRCGVTVATNIFRNNGALWVNWDLPDLTAKYTSADENRYFGWKDAADDTARQMAGKFVERFPQLVQEGAGADWCYAGWYVEMLGWAERGDFPMAYGDHYGEQRPGFLPTTKHCFDSDMPLPPGGLSGEVCKESYCRPARN